MLSKVKLNNTDLQVSQLCYGTNMLGWMLDQDKSNAILDRFVELGGNFIDSARSYGDWDPSAPVGSSERAIGAWLKGRSRDGIVIATKGGHFDMRVGDYRNRVTPEDITKDLTESLEHLQIDTIDLYWVHMDNPEAPVGPIIDMLIGHQKAGRIRYFGASNWTPERIKAAQDYAKSVGHAGFVAVEPFWGLAKPNVEAAAAQGYNYHYEGLYEELHASGLPMIPYSGQSRGFFTKVDAAGEDALRDDLKAFYVNDTNRARLKVVQALAKRHGVSINEVVLAYLTSQPHQTIPIIGASSPEQLTESVKAVDLKLTPAELEELRVTA